MNQNPTISVIIPLYNAAKTIVQSLKSVLNQHYSKIEIIIVNDGSTDNSKEIVEDFILRENLQEKILLIDKINGGVSSARNLGIKRSTGELIALLDSDDVWLPGKLHAQVAALKKYGVDFVGTLHNNQSLAFPYKLEHDIYKVTLKKMLIKMAPSTITSLFKRELIQKAGFYDEKQKYSEDANLWMRFAKNGKMIILNQNFAIAGGGKPLFGHSGLSGNLKGMYLGELKNLNDILRLKYINILLYILFATYVTFKYWRRQLIVKMRR
ncbi:glycosyltransferase family A protein [Niabella insulamsoli]|uniref:glycosyltransferase family 2 protein n=1 Tax=Niabella insulamsoli TaxID=3144874 RepID=UPI0031FE0433